jgi:ATP-binding cassette subfamily C protein CydD
MPYFVRYVPQLMLAVTVTPLIFVLVLGLDGLSAIIVIATLPLVPLFMVLIGLMTRDRSQRHLEAMARLSERTLDLVAGVPTLRGLGRERGPAERVRALGDAQRKATMGSLRIAFLSGMVLELLTTLAVAIVAVTLGFRLVDGGVSIETALAVLVLAPEVYLPLRAVGAHFHASADGLAAAEQAHEVLAEPVPRIGTPEGVHVDLAGASLLLRDVGVATPDGARLAPIRLTFTAAAGRLTALVGPNGEGKSTALLVAGALLGATAGDVIARQRDGHEVALHTADADAWLSQCGWVPQRPDLGPEGLTMSLGQRQLAALDGALTSGRPVLLLDEPTAHLDGAARTDLIGRLREHAARGATVIVATHDEALIAAAHAVVTVTARSSASLKGAT